VVRLGPGVVAVAVAGRVMAGTIGMAVSVGSTGVSPTVGVALAFVTFAGVTAIDGSGVIGATNPMAKRSAQARTPAAITPLSMP